jgi:hypothetical protein
MPVSRELIFPESGIYREPAPDCATLLRAL